MERCSTVVRNEENWIKTLFGRRLMGLGTSACIQTLKGLLPDWKSHKLSLCSQKPRQPVAAWGEIRTTHRQGMVSKPIKISQNWLTPLYSILLFQCSTWYVDKSNLNFKKILRKSNKMHAEAFLHNDAGTLKHEKSEPQSFAGMQDLLWSLWAPSVIFFF